MGDRKCLCRYTRWTDLMYTECMFTKFSEFERTVISESLSTKTKSMMTCISSKDEICNIKPVALDEHSCQHREEPQVLAQKLTYYYLKPFPHISF